MKKILKKLVSFHARQAGKPVHWLARYPLILMSVFVSAGAGWLSSTGFSMLFPFINEHGAALSPTGMLVTALLVLACSVWALISLEFAKIVRKLSPGGSTQSAGST